MLKKQKTNLPERETMIQPTPVNSPRDPLMTVKQTAAYLCVSKSFLDKARLTGEGPGFIRIGRKILYRKSVVDAWLQQRQFASTSQYGAK